MLLTPTIVFSEITRKVVEKYPDVSNERKTLPGTPKTVLYLDSKGKELAKELYDERGIVTQTTGAIPDGIVNEYYECICFATFCEWYGLPASGNARTRVLDMGTREIRVLVVDDSAYNRRTIIRMLEEIPHVKVIDYANDGDMALRKAIDLKPDLITLDLEC